MLELTLGLEKNVPGVVDITLGHPVQKPAAWESETVTNITQQIVHGNFTSISNSGAGAEFNLSIGQGNKPDIWTALSKAGISEDDAREFSEIISVEKADSKIEPFGEKAKAWIAKNMYKAANGTWNVGISVATQLLTEAALKYYGLK